MEEQMLIYISKQLDELTSLLTTKEVAKEKTRAGRPEKKHIVFRFRDKYPNSSKTQCVRMTELSIKTVSKYWDDWDAQWKDKGSQEVQTEQVQSEQEQMKPVKQVQGK